MWLVKLFFEVKRLDKKLSSTIFNQCINSAGNFLSIILIARILGIKLLGIYTICWSLITLLINLQYSLFLIPLLNIVPKLSLDSQKSYINANRFLNQIFVFISSTLFFFLMSIFGKYFGISEKDISLFFLLSLTTIVLLLFEFSRRLFFSKRELTKVVYFDITRYSSQLLLLFYLDITNQSNLYYVFLIMLFSPLMSLFIFKEIQINQPKNLRLVSTLKRNWNMAKWSLPTSLSDWVSRSIFNFITSIIYGTELVGIIKIIQSLFAVLNIPILGIENWAQVQASSIYNSFGIKALQKFIFKVTRNMLFLLIIFIPIILINSENFINIIYQVDVSNYKFSILIYSILPFITVLNINLKFYNYAMEKAKLTFFTTFIQLLVVISVSYPLINKFQLSGVFSSIALGQISSAIIYILYIYFRDIRYNKN